MPKDSKTETGSTIEFSLEIKASPEIVWKALTDAEELKNWFPLDARISPGKGGAIWLSWGDGMEGEAPIEAWEPNSHFRWVEGEDPATQVAVDFYLETHAGKTVLRLVDSGFGPGANWEDYYNSKHCGWDFELRSLRHYLEHHHGEKRHAVWVRRKTSLSREEAWNRLLGPEGLVREGSLQDLKADERYSVTAATGDRFEGIVHTFYPKWQFGATVENLNDSLLRVELEPGSGDTITAYVWLSAFGLPEAKINAFCNRWQDRLEKLFPERA